MQRSKMLGECLSCHRTARWWAWSRIWCRLRRHMVIKTRVGYPAVRTSRVDPNYLCQIGRCSHAPGECAWRA